MDNLIDFARRLRRDQTDAEQKLWRHLRDRQLNGHKFRRQHPEPPYILDFYCEKEKLAIEVDGGQHAPEIDKERTDILTERGIKILRFWNNEVLSNIEGVLIQIGEHLRDPSPQPSPIGRGSNRLLAGKITTAHGVRGLVKVLVFAEDATLLNGPLNTAATGDQTLTITLKNQLGGKADNLWLAAVEGITDRNAAEPLRGRELWIERAQLEKPDDNEYYVTDLIGLTVCDQAGTEIGTVRAFDNFGAGDLLDIAPVAGESFYLPFTDENIISVENGVITVSLPDGVQ